MSLLTCVFSSAYGCSSGYPTSALIHRLQLFVIASLIHYVFLQIPAEQLQVCESKLEAKDKDVEKAGLHSNKESNP